MDIVIIAQYLTDISKPNSNSRFIYIAKLLSKDNNVEIITTDFLHGIKKNIEAIPVYEGIKLTLLHESGYSKNVSLKRLASHRELAKNISKYLRTRDKPDVIYCAVPSLDVAHVAAQYCENNNVRFIIDIQDLWPEAFQMVFHKPVISDIIFYPMKRKANQIYKTAEEIVAVSRTYADRAMLVNNKCQMPTVAFLGTEKETFDNYNSVDKVDRDITVVYIGSLSRSYDIKTVIDAIAQLNTDMNVKLLTMGEGQDREGLETYAKEKNINAEFTGRLPYPQMVSRLKECDIAVNPIKRGSAGSIINKVGDYAMAGLPVINTQECEEYRQLLNQYNAGINCECENAKDVAGAIERLISDPELYARMGANNRTLGEELFDRKKNYERIVFIIEQLRKI